MSDPEYIRICDELGYHRTIVASALHTGDYTVLDSPACNADGTPRPPSFPKELGDLSKQEPESGTTSQKEGA